MGSDAALIASGSGTPVHALVIPGLGVFTDRKNWHPFTTTYGTARHYPWLDPRSLPDIREQIGPLEGSLEVEDIGLDLVDVGGGVTELVRDWRARGYAYLGATMDSTQTTATIDDVSWAAAGGDWAWCEREAMEYLSASATALTGLTRGALGTVAAEHSVDLDVEPPRRPLVTDGMHSLMGQRALLYRSAVDETGISAPTCIYRGRIVAFRAGHGVWRIELEHISAVLHEECCGTLPRTELKEGYWTSGHESRSLPSVWIVDSGVVTQRASTALSAAWHWSAAGLAAAWNATIHGDGLWLEPRLAFTDSDRVRFELVCDDTDAGRRLEINVYEGDPLWCLGFKSGHYCGEENTAYKAVAQDDPRLMVVDLLSGTALPEVRVEDPSVLTHGLFVASPQGPWIRVNSTVDASKRVILDRWWDETYGDYWEVEDAEDLVLQHVLAHGNARESMTLLSTVYTLLGVLAGAPEPDDWFPRSLQSADVDTDEWDDAFASVPPELACVKGLTLTEGVKAWDVIGPHLGVLGISPRITTNGKIGATRLGTPVPSMLASVELDSSVWSLDHAVDVEARVEYGSLLNVISIEHSHRYWDDKFLGTPIKIIWDDGLVSLGATRSIAYPLRGLRLDYWTETEIAMIINAQVVPTHFGQYGRASVITEIPCTWTAKQLRCGDYCKVSHDIAPDTVLGAIGLSERPALIVGRTQSLTGQEPDALLVQVYPAMQGAGIAPCARAASYTSTTAVLSLSVTDAYAQTDATDLDWLSDDRLPTPVQMLARGLSTSPPTVWDCSVTAVSGAFVKLASDAFSSAFPSGGVFLTLPDWDLALTWAREQAYIASQAAVPTLGTSADTAKEWTI